MSRDPNHEAAIALRAKLTMVGERLIELGGFVSGASLYAGDVDTIIRTHVFRDVHRQAERLAEGLAAYKTAREARP